MMNIYAVDGGFVIESHGCRLPGLYEDERAARFAFRLPSESLQKLRDIAVVRGNAITWEDIAKELAIRRR